MNIQQYNFGVDIDGTLTDTPPFNVDVMDLEETRKVLRDAPSKKGIEILSILNLNVFIITGRGDYFEEDSTYWLNKNEVPYLKLHTIDRNKYPGNRFNLEEYLKYKVNAYLENHIHFCLEDDIKVIEELEKYGIKGSLVKDDFEKAFWRLFE